MVDLKDAKKVDRSSPSRTKSSRNLKESLPVAQKVTEVHGRSSGPHKKLVEVGGQSHDGTES